MTINVQPITILDHQQTCVSIRIPALTGNTAADLRTTITGCLHQEVPVVYLDAKEVKEVDLSGINEVIHSYYTLQQANSRFVLVYRKDSVVEKWVHTTGLDQFVSTAILPVQ